MQENALTYAMLLKKSQELKLSFANLLGGAVLEEVVRRVSEAKDGDRFWLRNKKVLGEDQYQKNLVLDLEYDYVLPKKKKGEPERSDEEILTELAGTLRDEVFVGNFAYGVSFSQKDRRQKKYLLLQLSAEVEEMRVPISIKIYLSRRERMAARKESFSLMMFPEVTVAYYSGSPEEALAEWCLEIITKLELILNIGAYYDIYCLLGQESVDGRKVKELIEAQCDRRGIAKEKSRLALIEGYRDYAYMKKKWKAFLRSINEKEPSWEQALERFLKFFEPIWNAIAEDLVFFEDWMPELGRFL